MSGDKPSLQLVRLHGEVLLLTFVQFIVFLYTKSFISQQFLRKNIPPPPTFSFPDILIIYDILPPKRRGASSFLKFCPSPS
jgi:hypothetical protein